MSQSLDNILETKPTEETADKANGPIVSYEFKTLLGYGKFISGLGWVVIILSILGILFGLASGKQVGFAVAGGSIIFIITGIGMVVSGQLITCFVSIEKNTRATYELLRQKQT